MGANLELVRSICAAHERGDFSSADWADPDIEYAVVGGPDSGVWKGRAAMAKAWGEVLAAYTDISIVVEEIRQLDDERVLVLSAFAGRGKASGIDASKGIQNAGATLWQIRNGKVVRHGFYFDRDRALADLGLEE
jgi:ketosteroid isomerase-like protein